MNDWFEWHGARCTAYGVHVLEEPPFTMPAERATFTNVPEPMVAIYGSGDITLMVGMNIVGLFGISGNITLDTQHMEAFIGDSSANNRMSGDFPILLPGPNAVSWTGNVSRVVILPNWRYLIGGLFFSLPVKVGLV